MKISVDAASGDADRIPTPFPDPNATLDEVAGLPSTLRLRFAAWLRLSGRLDEATRLLDEIGSQFGETAALLDEQAAVALAAGDASAVRSRWQHRLASHPAPSARAALARALLELGEIDEAAAIAEELLAHHGELATVRALVAEVALLQGDLAIAHDYWAPQLDVDATRIAPQLALARIALLGGDLDEARAVLDRIVADLEQLTAAQLAAAASLSDLLGQPGRAQTLRIRCARLEVARAAALAAEIDDALGRIDPPDPNGRAPDQADRVSARRVDASASTMVPAVDSTAPEPSPATVSITEEEPLADGRVLEILRDVFGHPSLRPGQAAVINRALQGRDILAIMPTGAGKSLTFQLASLLLPGTTLVLSPLIALMKDQVEAMPPSLRQRAVLVNSTLSPAEQQRAVEEIAAGTYKLVYAAPERLRQHSFQRALRQAGVSLVVVDEAHCISLWGHDFRPDYLTIPSVLPELGDPPVLAITATATPRMEVGIAAGFGRELDRVRTSVFRPNLHYEVHRLPGREQKVAKAIEVCREERGAGIVYVSSRKDAEAVAGLLRDRGVGAIAYHAGLDPQTRTRSQDRFMSGQTRVVVATVAFGMGVDKSDVRFIVHLSPPHSLEAYAQESGRAGRDGLPARCVLLVAPADQGSLNRLARRDEQDIDTLRQIYAGVKRSSRGRWAIVDPNSLLPPRSYEDDPDDEPDPRIGLGLLEQARLLRRHPDAPVTYTIQLATSPGDSAAPTSDVDPRFSQLAEWSGLDDGRGGVTVRTADACDHLDLSPQELGRLLAGQAGVSYREGPRLVCLEVVPAGSDAGARLGEILARARKEAQARIQQVMNYASGTRCRHVALASHLGETLPPCGNSCDVCLDAVAPVERSRANAASAATTAAPTRLTADDALAVLTAVRTLPFPMGKTGLAKLLLGSVESRVRVDRSASFGALSSFKKGKIEGLIDRLVEDGFLFRDLDHEYKLIRLTERGAAASADDFIAYDEMEGTPRSASIGSSSVAGEDLSPEEASILLRLQDWRRERAATDAVPPYVVAHNATLTAIAQSRPSTHDHLLGVKGFGPTRTEKYGDEILAVVVKAIKDSDPD